MANVLVIGGGISGCVAASNLAEAGHSVTILESASRIGGKVLDYCCKATDECSRCGVCVAHTAIYDAMQDVRIRITTGATLEKAEPEVLTEMEIFVTHSQQLAVEAQDLGITDANAVAAVMKAGANVIATAMQVTPIDRINLEAKSIALSVILNS